MCIHCLLDPSKDQLAHLVIMVKVSYSSGMFKQSWSVAQYSIGRPAYMAFNKVDDIVVDCVESMEDFQVRKDMQMLPRCKD